MTREESIALYKAHSKRLYNVSLRIVGDSSEAEEIMQDTILKFITAAFRPTNEAQVAAWLKRTCIRASIDAVRKKKRERLLMDGYAAEEAPEYFAPVQPNGNGAFGDNGGSDGEGLDIAEVKKAMDELPDPYRLILDLVLIEGLDYGEVSRYTKVREGTVRTQYSRARAKLAEKLKTQMR